MKERTHIADLLSAVFGEMRESSESGFAERREQFVLHMTDWLDDAEDLLVLFRSENPTKEVAARQIVGFLYHVVPHLNAASRLLLDGVPIRFARPTKLTPDRSPLAEPTRSKPYFVCDLRRQEHRYREARPGLSCRSQEANGIITADDVTAFSTDATRRRGGRSTQP